MKLDYPLILLFKRMRNMKNLVKIIWLLALLMVIESCSNEQNNFDDLKAENLKGTQLLMDSLNEGDYPYVLSDSIWFLKLHNNKANCNVSQEKGDSIITKSYAFFRGGSREEYNDVVLSLSSNKDLFVLNYPPTGNKFLSLTKISKANYQNLNFNSTMKFDLTKLPAMRFVTDNFLVLSDSTIMVSGAPYNQIGHVFSVVNYQKGTLSTLDFWPIDGHDKDSLAKHSVYTDNCRIFKAKDKFLYMCGWERYAFIFTVNGQTVNKEKELYSTMLEYKEISEGNYQPQKISGKSLRMDANANAIYALMIEKNIEGAEPKKYMDSQFGNEIQVFDWDGTPIRHIFLDKVGRLIKVSEDNKSLYLFTENPQTGKDQIWKYKL